MTLGYTKVGSGPEPVLVMHDWSGSHSNYDPIRPYLDRGRFSYVFVDLRGYGLSQDIPGSYTVEEVASDCLEVADSLRWERFHLIGHSMTGLVTQWLALHATARVKSAIAVCPVSAAGFPLDEASWNFFCSVTVDDRGYRELQRSLCADRLSEGWLDAKLRWNRASTAPEARKAYLSMFSKADFGERVRGLPTPYLVVVGEHDAPGLRAEDMHKTFLLMHPDAELVVVPNCGHYPMQECPPYFAALMEKFLARWAA